MTSTGSSYLEMRSLALKTAVSSLKLDHAPQVYGAVMDLAMGERTATLVCFASGDASLYFSNGGGMIGASAIPTVRAAALRMVEVSSRLFDGFTPVEWPPVPEAGRTGFVIVSTSGLRSASDETEVTAGHHVISAFIEFDNAKQDTRT